jgi:hypothetical protein
MKVETIISEGERMIVLNKFGDAIAEGFVTDVTRFTIILKDDATGNLVQILKRHIHDAKASEITLTIIGSEL